MEHHQSDVVEKVAGIFRELVEDRAERILPMSRAEPAARARITAAMEDHPSQVANDIGFHLTDWNSDAAFLVALYLFPERFSDEEVKAGVINLLVHAPNHLAAAAKLAGHPISDVFELGDLLQE